MADDLQIRDYVDRTSVQADTEFMLEKLNAIDKTLSKVSQIRLGFGDAKGLKELKQLADQLSKVQNTLAKTTKEASQAALIDAKTSKENAAAKLVEAKAATEVVKAKTSEQKAREAGSKAAAAEEKMVADIANDYLQLSKAYNDAALRAKNYTIQLGENHKVTIQAVNDAKLLGDMLKKVDASVGQYQRNVGNYSSAFTGLNTSMQQIIREAPTLAISFEMFALAVSNNLPIFFDAIERAKKANIELAASGQKPVPILQQLGKSFTSMGGILTIAVTLFTIFSDKIVKFVKEAFQAGESIDTIKKNFSKLNTELKRTNDGLAEYFTYLDRLKTVPNLQLQIDSTNINTLGKLNKELGLMGTDLEDITKNRLPLLQDQFAQANRLLGSAQNAFFRSADKETIEAWKNGTLEGIKDGLSEREKILVENMESAVQSFRKANDELGAAEFKRLELTKQIELQSTEISKQSADERRQIVLDNSQAIANINRAKNEQIISDDRSSLNARLNAMQGLYRSELAIIEANKRFVLSDPTKDADQRNAAIRSAQTQAVQAELNHQDRVFRIKEEFRLRDIEAQKEIFKQEKELRAERLQELANSDQFSQQDRLTYLQAYTNTQREIIDEEFRLLQESVKNKYLTDLEKLQMQKDYETKILKLSLETQRSVTEILKSELEQRQALLEDDVEDVKRLYSFYEADASTRYAQDVIALNESLKKKEISHKNYLKKRADLDKDFSVQSSDTLISEINEQLKIYGGAELQLRDAELKKTQLEGQLSLAITEQDKQVILQKIELSKVDVENAKQNVDKKKALEKQLAEATIKSSDDATKKVIENNKKRLESAANILKQLVELNNQILAFDQAKSDARLQRIETEEDALERRYRRELDLINQTSITEDERKNRAARADAEYQAKRDSLEKRAREEKIRAARFEKQATIFNITLNTAAAIMSALSKGDKAGAIAAGIIGAAQLGVAVAQPIPRFFKGKNLDKAQANDKYEGAAWVDDGGKPEAILREDGSVEIGTDKPRITYLKRNDIVLPDATKLAYNATATAAKTIIYNTGRSDGLSEKTYMKGIYSLRQAIKNQPKTSVLVQNPIKHFISSSKGVTEFIGQFRS
jgi:hypothetical protein